MLTLLIDALAAYRLTRLVTTDKITEPLRDRVEELGGPRLTYLVGCDWCVGLWVAGAVTVARTVAPRAWEPVARGLAVAALVGITAENT